MAYLKSFTDKELEAMDLKTAQTELSNSLYEASKLIELIEFKRNSNGGKRITGNGHHIRQNIALYGSNLIAERWNE